MTNWYSGNGETGYGGNMEEREVKVYVEWWGRGVLS